MDVQKSVLRMRAARTLFLPVFAAVLVIAGCQSAPDPSIELLESELRWYEDQLYLMDRQLGQCCQQLESVRRYNQALQSELATAQAPDTSDDMTTGPRSGGNSILGIFNRRSRQRNAAGTEDSQTESPEPDQNILLPDISRGSESADTPDDGIPDASLGPDATDSGTENGSTDESFDEEESDFTLEEIGVGATTARPIEQFAATSDHAVAQVVFHPQLTGGHNSDGQPGDDGLYLVLEPRSQQGQYVPYPAELTIEVFEARTAQRSPMNRVARWDFDTSDTAAAMKKSLLGKGIHLQLAWPAGPPSTTDLVLVAKYILPDGTRLRTERSIRIDPTGQRSYRGR